MTKSIRVNRRYKDSMFRSLFRDKARFLELYNAIKGTNYGPNTPMVETTLEEALVMDEINDVSFLVDGNLVVFIEHQSSINYNMPLRMLMYVGRVMEVLMESRDIYREEVVEIPDVEFYVIYNGAKKFPKHKRLRLSGMRCAEKKKNPVKLELVVDIYNIYDGANSELLSRSRTLGDYEAFVEMFQRYYVKVRDRSKALKLTVAECRARGVQKEIIEIFAKGADNMIFTKFNLDDAKEVWQEEAEKRGEKKGEKKGERRGMRQGVKQGVKLGRAEVLALIKQGHSLDEIQKILEAEINIDTDIDTDIE